MNPAFMKQDKGWGKGKGKGKGKKRILKSFPSDQLVWVGNLGQGCDWKALQAHFNQAGSTKWIEVFEGKGKGTGAAAYATAAEAASAIQMLNGSLLNGQMIQ